MKESREYRSVLESSIQKTAKIQRLCCLSIERSQICRHLSGFTSFYHWYYGDYMIAQKPDQSYEKFTKIWLRTLDDFKALFHEWLVSLAVNPCDRDFSRFILVWESAVVKGSLKKIVTNFF